MIDHVMNRGDRRKPIFKDEDARARRMLAEALQRRRRGRQELEDRRKGDREKLKIARRLRGGTTMTLDWITRRLAMGTAGYAAQWVRESKQGKKHAILRRPLYGR